MKIIKITNLMIIILIMNEKATNKISFSYNSYKQLHRIGKSKEVNKLITTQDPVIIDELKIKNVDEEEERDLEIIYRPSTYRISKDDEVFVHFSISSSIFTLGDSIGCTLSFSPTSPVHCFQVFFFKFISLFQYENKYQILIKI